jgi:hypothetical protein
MDMDLEQLAARLQAMEDQNAQNQQQQAQSGFMDKYGMKFSNDGDLGVAILGELNRRGIDVSAADDAVQQILDQIRSEATTLLDKLKSSQAEVSDLANKINQIDESVMAAKGENAPPEAAAPPVDPMMAAPPPEAAAPPVDPMAGGMPPDMGAPPPADAGVLPPPADAGGAPPPPDMGAPPPDAGMAPPADQIVEQQPQMQMLSDERMKNIVSRLPKPKPVAPPKPTGWRPPSHILSGVKSIT